MEQPQYSMLERARVEKDYAPLYAQYQMGTTVWSPLKGGVLTGKYNDGIPKNSRGEMGSNMNGYVQVAEQNRNKIQQLDDIAKELGCSLAQLALAWCLKNPNVSTVITGGSSVDQVKENMKAIEFKNSLSVDVMKKIDGILDCDAS